MQDSKSILLCGATGLVGRECLRLLLDDPAFGRVVVLTRRPLPQDISRHGNASKLEAHVVDFEHLDAYAHLLRVDQIICALGTTIKQAGTRERFEQVDFGYPLALARLGAEQGAKDFILVSAIGANARSSFFYNRVKGKLEQAVFALPYRSITMVRPSLLLGERAEFRTGEEIAKRLAFLFPAKYQPVSARAVAAALVQAAKEDQPGRRVIGSDQIRPLADSLEAGGC